MQIENIYISIFLASIFVFPFYLAAISRRGSRKHQEKALDKALANGQKVNRVTAVLKHRRGNYTDKSSLGDGQLCTYEYKYKGRKYKFRFYSNAPKSTTPLYFVKNPRKVSSTEGGAILRASEPKWIMIVVILTCIIMLFSGCKSKDPNDIVSIPEESTISDVESSVSENEKVNEDEKENDNLIDSSENEFIKSPGVEIFDTTSNIKFIGPKEPNIDKNFTLLPGLYDAATSNVIYSWDELVREGYIQVDEFKLIKCDSSLSGHLIISENIASLSENAFKQCNSLTEITIPETVKTIPSGIFSDCSSLTKVYLPTPIDEI